MGGLGRIRRFFSNLEWQWSLITMVVGAITSFALPAWAVKAGDLFTEYSPVSWVAAGFIGALVFATTYVLVGIGRALWVRARYDGKMLPGGSYVDPMEKTFENRRIYLSQFCLPSHPLIEGKTFINCEIIGPANIVLEYANNVQEARQPVSDSVLMKPEYKLFNAIIVRSCVFRQCSFQRITFLVPPIEVEMARNWGYFNWLTPLPPEKGNRKKP